MFTTLVNQSISVILFLGACHGISTRSSPSTRRLSSLTSQVNRRKSPAIWRLLNDEQDHNQRNRYEHSAHHLRKKPEVMAPAGGWPQLKAAVANGADAVYVGLSAFSARARATNFDVEEDLPNAVRYCHDYNVKLYVALNTLVFDHEMEEVSLLIQKAGAAGIDALIVQDLGVTRVAQQVAPDIPIHSSTQQTITDASGVDFCSQHHGATRVVLGRELSVDEIASVTAETNSAEVEIFVHGALCVSYSGQCFSSEAWGGRSANRGQCAQACRMPYGLLVNGEMREGLADMKYVLSPQDLCGLDQVPALTKAGVACFKIEGRLKEATYVAATARAYRNAVDEAWESLHPTIGKADPRSTILSKVEEDVSKYELTQLFSRGQDDEYSGLTPGFLEGTYHQRLVRGRSPRHRGVHVGRVLPGSNWRKGIILSQRDDPELQLKLGDGVVIDRGMAEEAEIGGPIFSLEPLPTTVDGQRRVQIQLSREVMRRWKQFDQLASKGLASRRPMVPDGAHVWRTLDSRIEKKFRKLSEAQPPKRLVQLKVDGRIGTPLVVTITNECQMVKGETEDVLVEAKTAGLDKAKVIKAIGTLGDTELTIDGEVDVSGLDASAWCPVAWIKEARRKALANWNEVTISEEVQTDHPSLTHGKPSQLINDYIDDTSHPKKKTLKPKLSVLCRDNSQVDAVCRMLENGAEIDEIMVDFLELDGMREAVARIRQAHGRVVVVSPRILKPHEGGLWKALLSLKPDALMVRSTGLLHRLMELGGTSAPVVLSDGEVVEIPELLGDFSLNAANALTAFELLKSGLTRVTASYDLNANSIASMGRLMAKFANELEVVAHCKMPIFHTEHCVFARFLTKGDSFLDCGHACTRNTVHLRDQNGDDNIVLADMGCRNTVFTAQAQSGLHSIGQWVEAGISRFRVELVDENPEDAIATVETYLETLDGKGKASSAWERLQRIRDCNGRETGVALGSFRNSLERRAGELS